MTVSGDQYPDGVFEWSRIREYYDDLSLRYEQEAAWKLRHPDHDTLAYITDWRCWEDGETITGESSFDPDDHRPDVHDIFTVRLLLDILKVSMVAYQTVVNPGEEWL